MWSALCVLTRGSKRTRLLKHGMAGHIVEIVEVSWIANPWGRSSRSLAFSQPPAFGVWAADDDRKNSGRARPRTVTETQTALRIDSLPEGYSIRRSARYGTHPYLIRN